MEWPDVRLGTSWGNITKIIKGSYINTNHLLVVQEHGGYDLYFFSGAYMSILVNLSSFNRTSFY